MPVVTMRAHLTDSDIRTLIKGPSDGDRAQAAHKLCRCIEEAELSVEERSHADSVPKDDLDYLMEKLDAPGLHSVAV